MFVFHYLKYVKYFFYLFRVQLTKLVYTVTIDGRATFPADYPPPASSVISTELSTSMPSVSVYASQAQPVRVDRTFSVTVKGSVVASVRDEIETGLANAWSSLTNGNTTSQFILLIQ